MSETESSTEGIGTYREPAGSASRAPDLKRWNSSSTCAFQSQRNGDVTNGCITSAPANQNAQDSPRSRSAWPICKNWLTPCFVCGPPRNPWMMSCCNTQCRLYS